MKKIISVLCALALLLALVPQAQAWIGYLPYYQKTGYTWLYQTDGNEATIWGLLDCRNLQDTHVIIPPEVNHNGKWIPVTRLDHITSQDPYSAIPNMEVLSIPYTVKAIGRQTFADCKKLQKVIITDLSQLTTIEDTAFVRCTQLNDFSFQKNVTTIGSGAFADTALTIVYLSGTKLTSIGGNAFANTNVTHLTLPKTIQSIGQNAFYTKNQVSDVYYAGSPTMWKSVSIGSGNRLSEPQYGIIDPPTKPTVDNTTSCTTTPTNAVVKAVFTASESGNWTKSGVRLYNASGTQIASKEETHNYNMSQLSVWYDVNSELGKTLSPNTNYSFEIYTYFNGEVQTTGRVSFKTDIKTELTWYNTVESVTNNSFTFSLEGRANTTGTFSEYRFTLKDAQTGKQLVNFVNSSDTHLFTTGASWFKLVSWDTSKWGRLAQNHTYLYQASYVFNGSRYYSDWYSVTTTDTWAPYMDGDVQMFKKSNNKVDFTFFAHDGDKVQDVKCYVYNDVDGLDAKVQVDYSIETNELVHWWWYEDNFWTPPRWDYEGRGTFDIDQVGGRRDCYYYMQFVITDRMGNVTTESTQAMYEQNPDYYKRINAKDEFPVTTRVDAALTGTNELTLSLEGGDPIGVSGFKVAVYPETMTEDSAYWLDVNEAAYKGRESIDGTYLSIYTASAVVDLNDTGFTGEENLCVSVYTVQDLGEYMSLSPMTALVAVDRQPPRYSGFVGSVESGGAVTLDVNILDASDIDDCWFTLWDAENEEITQSIGGSINGGHVSSAFNWNDSFSTSHLVYAQACARDIYQNYSESQPVLLHFGISPTLMTPAGLVSIDSEAFSGTSARTVNIRHGCVSIGSRAFASCPNLRYAFIPSTVNSIAVDAFAGSNVTIVSPYSSYAHYFAQTNGIPWVGHN